MTQTLVDPQLAAFYASNPEILQDPSILVAEPPQPHLTPRELAETELSIAFLVMAYAVSRTLARQQPTSEPAVQAGHAWNHHAPLWMRIAVPALISAYDGLPATPAEKQAMAEEYAETLGEYLNESSAESLAAGYNQQAGLRGGQVSWVRSVTAYGCDAGDTRGIMATLIAGAKDKAMEPVTAAAKIAIQKARAARADLLGQTEARTASEAAKAIIWINGQATGEISPAAAAVWRTHEHETDCPTCGPMDGVARPLSEPFAMPDGRALWAACAHPHCQCHAELVDASQRSETIQKAKDRDPYNRDNSGRFADREYRTRTVTYAEPDPAAVAIAQELAQQVINPFGVDMRTAEQRNPFASVVANPFAASVANPFATATPVANPFLDSENPFLAPEVVTTPADAATRSRRKVAHHVFLGVKRAGPAPEPKTETHYLAMSEVDGYFYDMYGAMPDSPNDAFDFDDMNDWFTEQEDGYGETGERASVSAWPTPSVWNAAYEQIEDLSDDEWSSVVTQALPIWHASQHHADSILAQLSGADLQEIYGRAGYGYHRGGDPDAIRQAIAANIFDSNSPDRSLQEAYSDYVTWVRPELVGENGMELGHRLAAIMGESDWADWATPPRGVMVFDQGFHGGTSELHGTYGIAHVVYRSALADFGRDAPNGKLSVQEMYMEPIGAYDERAEPVPPEPTGREDKHPWD